jgi:hypothetical protein
MATLSRDRAKWKKEGENEITPRKCIGKYMKPGSWKKD